VFTEIKKVDEEFRKHITVIRSELHNEAEAKLPYPQSENEGVHKHMNSKCFYATLSILSNFIEAQLLPLRPAKLDLLSNGRT